VEKSTFTWQYDLVREKLIEMRKNAKLSQRALAAKLGRERSFVARIELAERRLDLVEFSWVCKACGVEPAAAGMELLKRFASDDKHGRRGRRSTPRK
jgi:transcriptional regulator with XRE-family HTH domain